MFTLSGRQEEEDARREDRATVAVKHGHRARRHSKSDHTESQKRVKHHEVRLSAQSGATLAGGNGTRQTSLAALGAVAAYATVRGSIKFFHHARRGMLRQMLIELCPNLSHVNYWLDFGSLLGIHRDGDLILYDNDIDLAILNPNWQELEKHLSQALPNYCVRLEIPSEAPDSSFLRVYCALGFADLFGAVELNDGRLLVDCGHGELNCIERQLVVPTEALEWRGVTINVPRNLEGALHARYGPTWRIPRYMDKGADVAEGNKVYAKVFRALSKVGIRL